MMSKVAIIVNSCDKYKDAWDPFFKLLKIQWPECINYEIILNSETEVYNCDFLDVKTICGGKTTWSSRLKSVLNKTDSDLIVFLLEDFFLKSPVSQSDFLKSVDLMSNDSSVGYIGLKYRPERKLKDGSVSQRDFISRDDLQVNYRIPLISSIWNKKFFIKLLRNHETPWEFEEYAGIRSKKYKYKIFDINNNQGFCNAVFDYDIDMQYGIGIAKGKWLMPKTKEFLDSYGIEVNYNNLGVDFETYYKAIGNIHNTPEDINNSVANENTIKEFLYCIKKFIVKLPTKLKKFIRKIKSLI